MSKSLNFENSLTDRLKSERDKLNVDYNVLLKKYFIDEFLRKLSKSEYSNNFIWKGGFILSAITGIKKRTTVDLDTLLNGVNIDIPTLTNIMNTIMVVENNDNIVYSLIDIKEIQSEKTYPGLRVRINGQINNLKEQFHLDVATGEKLDPSAITWRYKPLLDDDPIDLLIYRPERMLAEKLQTLIERGLANTRMKDFYDIYIIPRFTTIDSEVLANAFQIVMSERNTLDMWEIHDFILDEIKDDIKIQNSWERYQIKSSFVGTTSLDDTLLSAKRLFGMIQESGLLN